MDLCNSSRKAPALDPEKLFIPYEVLSGTKQLLQMLGQLPCRGRSRKKDDRSPFSEMLRRSVCRATVKLFYPTCAGWGADADAMAKVAPGQEQEKRDSFSLKCEEQSLPGYCYCRFLLQTEVPYSRALTNKQTYCTIWHHIVQYGIILYNMVSYCTI